MAHYVVWMDHQHAKLFKFVPGEVVKSEVQSHGAKHHNGHLDNANQNHLHKFYNDLASHLKDADEVLIVGSGVAKTEFKHYVEKHGDKSLNKKIVGVENMDKATDKEIEIKARSFFTKHDLFN